MHHPILLARHATHAEVARVLSGRSEIALDARGREQATRLAERLASEPLAAIHSSPRRRAVETGQAVATRQDLAVTTVPGLDEIDFGEWQGSAFADLESDPLWKHWNTARGSVHAPGGESMREAVARAAAHLESINEGGSVLCVTHGDIIRGVAAHYLGLGLDRMLGFDCDPASVTTIVVHEGRGHIVALNERPR